MIFSYSLGGDAFYSVGFYSGVLCGVVRVCSIVFTHLFFSSLAVPPKEDFIFGGVV